MFKFFPKSLLTKKTPSCSPSIQVADRRMSQSQSRQSYREDSADDEDQRRSGQVGCPADDGKADR